MVIPHHMTHKPPYPSRKHYLFLHSTCMEKRNPSRVISFMCRHDLPAHIFQVLGCCLFCGIEEVDNSYKVTKGFNTANYETPNEAVKNYGRCKESLHPQLLCSSTRQDLSYLKTQVLIASLKSCTESKDVEVGCKIHVEVSRRRLLGSNTSLDRALVEMYTKHGLLAEAKEALDEVPVHDVALWNALIGGYMSHECYKEALRCLEEMRLEGIVPNSVTFICSLKACHVTGTLDKGRKIHAEISRRGLLEKNVIVGNALLAMYAKYGLLRKAREVFDQLSVKDIVSWTSLIDGHAKHGDGMEALKCFDQMRDNGFPPNAITFVCCLKACGSVKALEKGKEIHNQIEKEGLLGKNITVGNALLDMYVKCGMLTKAQEVFDKLLAPDVVSWTTLIAGYAKYGGGEEALNCYELMRHKGVPPNAVTFVCCLTACGRIGDIERGQGIHNKIVQSGLLKKVLAVGNALVDMYATCGLLTKAHEVFDELFVRDVISWNALMSGYVKHERGEEALNCYEKMQLEGVSPDVSTLVCTLKACSSIQAVEKGEELHTEISKNGYLEKNVVVGSALVDMYVKFGLIERAREVFDNLSGRDVIAWNALITGYAQQELGQEVLSCFKLMQEDGVSPDPVTLVCSLKACGSVGAIDKGEKIHAEIAKQGLLGRDVVIGSALVDMYAKCGSLGRAREVFDKLYSKDTVSWTALISGYSNRECGKEALKCFEQMQGQGVVPNVVTYVCSLKACGSIGATDKGREIHADIARKGGLERDLVVGSALVEMYAKGGLLLRAQEVFHGLPLRDVNSWNVLISGYARHEHGIEALKCFEEMQGDGVLPDSGTFMNVLDACCHAELVNKGHTYFEIMSRDYGINPALEHHSCMVMLLGRSGNFDAVGAMVQKMPFEPNFVVRDTVLGACRKWGNVEFAMKSFKEAT